MLHCQKNVNRALIYVQLDNLFQFLLTNLTDSSLDLGDFPDENLSIRSTSYCLLRAWQEDRLRVRFVLLLLRLLANRGTIVLESLRLVGPFHEKHAIFAVTGEFMWIHRVEFDPVSWAEIRLVVELHGDYRPIFVFVSPVPQRARLRLISAKSRNVAVISRQVHHHDTTRVWLQEGSHRSARVRVPDD